MCVGSPPPPKCTVEHQVFPGLPAAGPEAIREAFTMFGAAFPDLRVTLDDVIAEGDQVGVRVTMSGTQQGEFMGMPPTNKGIKIQVIDIIEWHDGKQTAHWGVTGQGAMMEQLGLAPDM